MAGPPPADDCADVLVVHAQSAEEMTGYMWELGFDTAEFETARHAVVVQLPGRVVIVLLDEKGDVLHAESAESPTTEEDIRAWKEAPRPKREAPPE